MFAETYRAGPVTKSRSDADRGLSRLELHRWTLLVLGIAYWANVVRTAPPVADATGIVFAFDAVLGHGAFCVVAWAMLAALVWRQPATAPAARREVLLALAIALLGILPARQATVAALIALALLFTVGRDARAMRQAGVILAGLAVEMIWTSTYAMPLHATVARFDAVIVRALLGVIGIAASAHGASVGSASGSFDIEILGPCAASFPLAGVGLAFVVVTIHQGRLPRRGDLPWLAAALLASIVLTELRLGWMATGQVNYLWLHDGAGASLYAVVAAILAGAFPLLATRRPA